MSERPLRVLQVNDADLRGRNFSGYDLLTDLKDYNIHGRQAVLRKSSENPAVFSLWTEPGDQSFHDALWRVELRRSMNNLLFPWGLALSRTEEFAEADVVHYHLIHNQMMSLFDLPGVISAKPSVWTFHDMWPMTGHCIQPVDCDRWRTGCDVCPSLDAGFVLREDFASRMWRIKQRVFSNLDVDVIVASDLMADRVRSSPITAHLKRVHTIPFGIDIDTIAACNDRSAARASLGIAPDDFVVLFRASPQELKGLRYIVEALRAAPPMRSTTLLTVDHCGLVSELDEHYTIRELGWVDDAQLYSRAFGACDVLVMPSLAEGFGLMAVEAMAAGRPVICFQDTTLVATTHVPECGIAVPLRSAEGLRAALDTLAGDPDEVVRRGEAGRRIAHEQYGRERYLSDLASLYRRVAGRCDSSSAS